MQPNTNILILAAGDGKRMKSNVPKVMTLFRGRPLIEHVVATVEATGLGKPLVVVSPKHTLVQDYLGPRVDYVVQREQLGTGHAVACAETFVSEENIVVLYGDMPFVSPRSVAELVEEHTSKENFLTLMTTTVSDFLAWRSPMALFGRVVRNQAGVIERIVEGKDATSEELQIKELLPCFFSFRATWLWATLKKLKNDNVQKEYYLVDTVGLAVSEHVPISSLSIDPKEALGINTAEDLETLERLAL